MEMVRACLRVLRHHGVIALVDMFFYSNRYECTEKVASLFSDNDNGKLLQDAVEFIVKRHANSSSSLSVITARNREESPEFLAASPRARMLDPNQSNFMSSSFQAESFRDGHLTNLAARRMNSGSPYSNTQDHFASLPKRDDYNEIRRAVAELFCALQRTITIGELWIALVSKRIPSGTSADVSWKKMFHIFDHRRLATFGQVHGLIKRVHAFPLLVDGEGSPPTSVSEPYHGKEHQQLYSDQGATRSFGQSKTYCLSEKRRKAVGLATSMMDGMTCDDAIVCACEMPLDEICRLFPNSRIATVYSTLDEP